MLAVTHISGIEWPPLGWETSMTQQIGMHHQTAMATPSDTNPARGQATTFHSFPRLPFELRQQIWEQALLVLPGFVFDADDLLPVDYDAIKFGEKYIKRTYTEYVRDVRYYPFDRTLLAKAWMPAIFEAHPEAHIVARSMGLLWDDLLKSHRIRTHWFNPEKDALFFTPAHLTDGSCSMTKNHQLREFFSTVKKAVVMEGSCITSHAFLMLSDHRYFPSLQTIIEVPMLELLKIDLKDLVVSTPKNSSSRAQGFDDLVFMPHGKSWVSYTDSPRAHFDVDLVEFDPSMKDTEPKLPMGSPFALAWMLARSHYAEGNEMHYSSWRFGPLGLGIRGIYEHSWRREGWSKLDAWAIKELEDGYRLTRLKLMTPAYVEYLRGIGCVVPAVSPADWVY